MLKLIQNILLFNNKSNTNAIDMIEMNKEALIINELHGYKDTDA